MHVIESEEEIIIIQGLVKKFGTKTLFNNFTVSMPKRGLTCVMGPNGSGKTTLLKIIAGLEPFEDGFVIVGSESTFPRKNNGTRAKYSREVNVGFVFQEPRLLPWKNVLDNVTYGLKIKGVSKKQREEMGREMLEQFGLDSVARVYPHQLSGGMRQKVNIARALITTPEILLLDEPFNNLDVVIMEEAVNLLQDLRDNRSMTIIMVNHYLELSSRLSDHIIFLDGQNEGQPRVISKWEVAEFDREVKTAFQQLQLQNVVRDASYPTINIAN